MARKKKRREYSSKKSAPRQRHVFPRPAPKPPTLGPFEGVPAYYQEVDPRTGMSLSEQYDDPPDSVMAEGIEAVKDWYYRRAVRSEIGIESGPPRHYPAGEYPERGGDRTTVGGEPWNPNMQQHLERIRQDRERLKGPFYQASVPSPPRTREGARGMANERMVPTDRDVQEFGEEWNQVWRGIPRRPESSDLGRELAPQLEAPRGPRREYPLPSGIGGPFPHLQRQHVNRYRGAARIGDPLFPKGKGKSISELQELMRDARKELDEIDLEGKKWEQRYKEGLGLDLEDLKEAEKRARPLEGGQRHMPPGFFQTPGGLGGTSPLPSPPPRLVPPGSQGQYPMESPPPPPMPRLIPPGYMEPPQRFQRPRAESQYAPPAPPAEPADPRFQPNRWGMQDAARNRINPWSRAGQYPFRMERPLPPYSGSTNGARR